MEMCLEKSEKVTSVWNKKYGSYDGTVKIELYMESTWKVETRKDKSEIENVIPPLTPPPRTLGF